MNYRRARRAASKAQDIAERDLPYAPDPSRGESLDQNLNLLDRRGRIIRRRPRRLPEPGLRRQHLREKAEKWGWAVFESRARRVYRRQLSDGAYKYHVRVKRQRIPVTAPGQCERVTLSRD